MLCEQPEPSWVPRIPALEVIRAARLADPADVPGIGRGTRRGVSPRDGPGRRGARRLIRREDYASSITSRVGRSGLAGDTPAGTSKGRDGPGAEENQKERPFFEIKENGT